jgi:hypothetical protein
MLTILAAIVGFIGSGLICIVGLSEKICRLIDPLHPSWVKIGAIVIGVILYVIAFILFMADQD